MVAQSTINISGINGHNCQIKRATFKLACTASTATTGLSLQSAMAAAVAGTGAAAAPAPAAEDSWAAAVVMPPYCSLPSSGRRVSFLSQPRVSDAIYGIEQFSDFVDQFLI